MATLMLKKLTATRVPANAVMFVAFCAAAVTLPALVEVNIGTLAAFVASASSSTPSSGRSSRQRAR